MDLEAIKKQSPEPLNEAQSEYLTGFFAGVSQRAVVFKDLFGQDPNLRSPEEDQEEEDEILIPEERIKREEHPLDSYYRLVENARSGREPSKDEIFRFKWNGLFYETPVSENYMARLRIPGGQLSSHQARELARISAELTTGYIQITTRANFQIRHIGIRDTPEVLRRVQGVGLHSQGSGADNIRNITGNPTAGVDPVELIDCTPYVNELANLILSQRKYYDLPRKFNIAYDGGGLIGSVEDTNDIGAKAVEYTGEDGKPQVGFRIAVGGATGHQSFAHDFGLLVTPGELNKVIVAILDAFIANGNRGNRKKARLKHLLEDIGTDAFRDLVEACYGRPLPRRELKAGELRWPASDLPHSHVGVYEQKQQGMYFVGIFIPVGQMSPKQLGQLADLAEKHGSARLRLSVWQNLIIPDVPEAEVRQLEKAIRKIGFTTQQTNAATGFVACTGARHCKYASTHTKEHGIELMKHVDKKFDLPMPVNIHFTGCPNSCAQHYMGDIGMLGTKTRDGHPAYHVFVGGGFGPNQACGRQVFTTLPWNEAPRVIETMLHAWLAHREEDESFQAFTQRHDLNTLQTLFSGQAA